jgi:hypothetical protein
MDGTKPMALSEKGREIDRIAGAGLSFLRAPISFHN